MNRAKGPVWHKQQKDKGIVPDRLRGLDKEATWCTSHADGWIYGHGSFALTSHRHETAFLKGHIDYVSMDSKADSYPLYREFNRQKKMTLVTSCRRKENKTKHRILMHQSLQTPKLKQIYKERSYRVEPMQGLVKDIFDLDHCWMRGNKSNRWLFAAMGLAIQMHQLDAFKEKRSTWKIKTEVLG